MNTLNNLLKDLADDDLPKRIDNYDKVKTPLKPGMKVGWYFKDDKEFWEEEFFNLLSNFKFVPGGRILSNAGTRISGTTLINCFVDGFIGYDKDSMNGIMDALKRQAMILKSEGGYGFNVSTLRPKGTYINGIANDELDGSNCICPYYT